MSPERDRWLETFSARAPWSGHPDFILTIVPAARVELATVALGRRCSDPLSYAGMSRARDRIRTCIFQLRKLVLSPLSYTGIGSRTPRLVRIRG